MYSVVLQDWITIRGTSAVGTVITQGENGWIGTAAYEDIIFWIDVREVNSGGATNLVLNLQTSPLKEEFLFVNMVAGINMAASSTIASPTKVLLNGATTLVPLARWVRWTVGPVGGAVGSTWDATFRIIAACNAVSQIPQAGS